MYPLVAGFIFAFFAWTWTSEDPFNTFVKFVLIVMTGWSIFIAGQQQGYINDPAISSLGINGVAAVHNSNRATGQ